MSPVDDPATDLAGAQPFGAEDAVVDTGQVDECAAYLEAAGPGHRTAGGGDAAVVLDLPGPDLTPPGVLDPTAHLDALVVVPGGPHLPPGLPEQEPSRRTSSSEALADGTIAIGTPREQSRHQPGDRARHHEHGCAADLTRLRVHGPEHEAVGAGLSPACAPPRTTRWGLSSWRAGGEHAPLSLSFQDQFCPTLLLSISASTSIRPSSALALIFQSVLALHGPLRGRRRRRHWRGPAKPSGPTAPGRRRSA